jgi:PKD repeat protein
MTASTKSGVAVSVVDVYRSQHTIETSEIIGYADKVYRASPYAITITVSDANKHFIFNYTDVTPPPPPPPQLPPVAVINITTPSIEQNAYKYYTNRTIHFSAENSIEQSSNIIGYSWKIQKDGLTMYESNNAVFDYVFPMAGTYNVTLTVSSSDGLAGTKSIMVYIVNEESNTKKIFGLIPDYSQYSLYIIIAGLGLMFLSMFEKSKVSNVEPL